MGRLRLCVCSIWCNHESATLLQKTAKNGTKSYRRCGQSCAGGVPYRHNAVADSILGAAAHLGNLRIAEIIQGIEQEPFPLGGSAESQHRQDFIQCFPLANQFFRCGAVGQAALRGDYVLVKFAAIPMPPLFMEQVLRFVICPIKKFIDFQRDLHGHSLSVIIDGNFHLSFLHSDFFGKI